MSTSPTSMFDYLDALATIAGGLFAGTAFYFTVGQVPALQEFGLNEFWRYFPIMYKKVAVPQGTLTTIAGLAGIAHATRIHGSPFDRNLWLAAGTTFVATIPYTLLVLGPINRAIIEENKSIQLGGAEKINIATKKDLLDKWAVLHSVRTVSSIAAFGAMLFGLTRHSSLMFTW